MTNDTAPTTGGDPTIEPLTEFLTIKMIEVFLMFGVGTQLLLIKQYILG